MAKKRRGPQPPKGRAKPIGPVLGLARAQEGVYDPVKKTLITEAVWTDEEGPRRTVATRARLDNTHFKSRLLAVAGGGIQVGSVNQELALTPAQRKPVTYSPTGDIRFEDPRQVFSGEQWEGLEDPGRLLVVQGYLGKTMLPGGTGTQFTFEQVIWDVAEPDRHLAGKLVLPQAEAL